MDSYPQFLLKDLRPLVFITSTIDDDADLHGRLVTTLEKCNSEIDQRDFPALYFKPVSIDHAYVTKKNPKEYQSVDGILKYSSLQKHFELLPSVVVLTVAFSVEWQASDWAHLSDSLLEKVNKLRDQLRGRDVRVVVIAVRTGTGQMAPEVVEEKTGNLRRHLSLENHRTFVAINLSDLTQQPATATMKRVSKNLRELSYMYYNVLEKRARFLLKTARIRGSNEGILTVRYSFKLAYFLSFQGLKLQALKYYRQCYESLIGLVYHLDEDLVDQLKAVAEFTHFKICNMFLQTGSAKDAISQFMVHISTFAKVYAEMAWKHYSWISDQHIVFLQLLDLHKISNASLSAEPVDRYFFLQNALRYALKRQQDFRRTAVRADDTDEADKRSRNHLLSLVVSPAKYVGAIPVLIDPVLGSDSALHLLGPSNSTSTSLSLSEMDNNESKLTSRYLTESERAVDVSGFIFRLLQRCDDYLESCTVCSTRRRANVSVLLSEQLMAAGRYEQALTVLTRISESYSEEAWVGLLVSLLRRILSCCVLLGRPEEYLAAAVRLYSVKGREGVHGADREHLHSDILSLLKSDLPYGPPPLESAPSVKSSGTPDSKTSLRSEDGAQRRHSSAEPVTGHLYHRPSYGSAACPDKPCCVSLPLRSSIAMSDRKGSLFDISAEYSHRTVEVGNTVTVSLTIKSRMLSTVTIDEMCVSFTGDRLSKKIVHPIGQISGEEAENISTLSKTGPVHPQGVTGCSPQSKHRGPCCSRYCSSYMGAVEGKRIVTTHTHSAHSSSSSSSSSSSGPSKGIGREVSYACLSIPPDRAVTYTFSLLIPESVLPSLPPTDLAVCVEVVKITLRTPLSLPHMPPSSPPQNPYSGAAPDLTLPIPEHFREVVLEISPISHVFRKALQDRKTGIAPSTGIPRTSPLQPIAWCGVVWCIVSITAIAERYIDEEIVIFQFENIACDLPCVLPPSPCPPCCMPERIHTSILSLQPLHTSPLLPSPHCSGAAKQVYSLSDLSAFLGPERCPKVLLLTRPLALLELLSPCMPSGHLTVQIEKKPSRPAPQTQTTGVLGGVVPTAQLLQGPVQRLDLIFKTGDNHIINGKIYLSSDFSPASSSSALFWSPDIGPLIGTELSARTPYMLDTIAYHPILLNSSYQPAQPLLLPHLQPNSVYCVPLFLRSEIQGSYKLRLLTEFVPKIGHTSTVSKEVELAVTFLKPLNMNFSLSSEREAQCGVVREGFMSTVLEGDTVNMSASLGCANALGGEIQILGMTFLQPPQTAQVDDYYDDNGNINDSNENEEGESPKKLLPSLFRLLDGASSVDLLHPVSDPAPLPLPVPLPLAVDNVTDFKDATQELGTLTLHCDVAESEAEPEGEAPDAPPVTVSAPIPIGSVTVPIPASAPKLDDVLLRKGEVYVCSTDILCVESPLPPTLPFTAQVASMGDLYIDWRLHNDRILSPPDLVPWGEPPVPGPVPGSGSGATGFEWLLQWGPQSSADTPPNPAEKNKLAIDQRTSTTRVCGMVFSVPRVKVSPAPFTVCISLPPTCKKNQVLPLEIIIRNKLWSAEHLSLTVETAMDITSSSAGPTQTQSGGNSPVKPDNPPDPSPASSSGFLVVGNASALLDISPKGSCPITLSLVPLQTGFLRLPHICVVWERNNATVVEISSAHVPKCIFVRP